MRQVEAALFVAQKAGTFALGQADFEMALQRWSEIFEPSRDFGRRRSGHFGVPYFAQGYVDRAALITHLRTTDDDTARAGGNPGLGGDSSACVGIEKISIYEQSEFPEKTSVEHFWRVVHSIFNTSGLAAIVRLQPNQAQARQLADGLANSLVISIPLERRGDRAKRLRVGGAKKINHAAGNRGQVELFSANRYPLYVRRTQVYRDPAP